MPRSYRLGERTAQVEATHERIIEAAIDLYLEIGISAATMREIGVRADVAPGTLRKHFPTRDDLDRAMVERLTSGLTLPDPAMFAVVPSIEERVGRLIRTAATFIDEARRVYVMWLREPMLTQPWAEKGAEFGRHWDGLMQSALGSLGQDKEALAVLRAVLQPSFFDTLRAGGRSTEEAAAIATSVVAPWFSARARGRAPDA